jgi:hypothetical protein
MKNSPLRTVDSFLKTETPKHGRRIMYILPGRTQTVYDTILEDRSAILYSDNIQKAGKTQQA